MGEPSLGYAGLLPAELIGWWWERGEVKHLSTCWKRYFVSSGERKRRSLNLVCVIPVGGCIWGVVGCCFPATDMVGRSDKSGV